MMRLPPSGVKLQGVRGGRGREERRLGSTFLALLFLGAENKSRQVRNHFLLLHIMEQSPKQIRPELELDPVNSEGGKSCNSV